MEEVSYFESDEDGNGVATFHSHYDKDSLKAKEKSRDSKTKPIILGGGLIHSQQKVKL